jgi:Domain of unknown function (DUF4833)
MKNICYFLLFISITTQAQKGYPTPAKAENHLFYIQHSQNHNTFVYEANFTNKKFDDIEPIKIHRIAYTNGGAKEELTKIQRKLAYGIEIQKLKENHYEFSLVSYPEKKLYLELSSKGKPHVRTTVNGKKMILHKMFLSMDKSNGLKPKIEYIDFHGTDTESGKEIKERFYLK